MSKLNILFTICFLMSCSYMATSQDTRNLSWNIGPELKVDKVRSSTIKNNSLFWNYGLKNQLIIKEKWIVELGVYNSIRNYKERQDGLRFMGGITAYFESEIDERLIELETQLKYQFLSNEFRPFIGIGYSIQLPYTLTGERKIVESDGSIGYLSKPQELVDGNTYGLYSSLGMNYEILDRLIVMLELGGRWYYNSNLNIYGYPSVEEHPNRHKSFIFGFGLLYKLK